MGIESQPFTDIDEEITDILRWVLMGFNSSFLKSIAGRDDDIEALKKSYIKQLKGYLSVLKKGL